MYFREASPLSKQIWAVSSVLLFNMGCGMMKAQTTLESFIQADSPVKEDSQISWIGSSEPVTIILGLLSSALLMHWSGRRAAFIMNTIASIISCFTIYFATSSSVTTVGLMFRDFSGSGVILGAMAIGEYTSPIYRGVFLTLASASIEIGRMTAYFIGNYKIIAIFALIQSILSCIIVCTWDESPYYLASRYKYDECKKSFIWLRGTSFNERQEIAKLIQKGKESESKVNKQMGMLETLLDVSMEVTKAKFLKPVIVILFASVLLEASGKTIFDTYGEQIVGKIFGKHSSFYNLAIHFIAPISMVFSSILTKVLKRRTLLFHTGSTSVIFSFVISFTIFLISTTIISFTTFVSLALLLFLMMTNLSCSTVFLTWCGELFPLEQKSVGLVVCGLIFNVNNYLCLKITPYLLYGLKLHGLFGLLTVLQTLTLLTLYFIAPETHDQNLLQIECYFENGDFEIEEDELRKGNEDISLCKQRNLPLTGQIFL